MHSAHKRERRWTVELARARVPRNLFLFVWKRYAAVNGSSGERMHARNERSTLFSCARITICSIRSRQSLKLFDARGLSISLLRPRSIHAALSTALRVLIMNIVFYDPAFSFVSRFFFPFSLFFSPRLRLPPRHGYDRIRMSVFFGRVVFNDRRWSIPR